MADSGSQRRHTPQSSARLRDGRKRNARVIFLASDANGAILLQRRMPLDQPLVLDQNSPREFLEKDRTLPTHRSACGPHLIFSLTPPPSQKTPPLGPFTVFHCFIYKLLNLQSASQGVSPGQLQKGGPMGATSTDFALTLEFPTSRCWLEISWD